MCFVSYLVAGVSGSGWIGLATGAVLLVIFASVMMAREKKHLNPCENKADNSIRNAPCGAVPE